MQGAMNMVTNPIIDAFTTEIPILRDGEHPFPVDTRPDFGKTAIIGGIKTSLASRHELALMMQQDVVRLRQGVLETPRIVTASNGYVIATYHLSPRFRTLIDGADLVDADGMSLVFASRLFLKKPLIERAATTDFIEDASRLASENRIKFYFLGAKPGVADLAADKLRARHPGLQIVGTRDGYFDLADIDLIAKDINDSGAEILWLGMGSPVQEEVAYMLQARAKNLAWIRTCGGLFDHCSGTMPRANKLMQRVGLEWLHRAALEPRRLGRRYALTNPVALFHLLTKTRDI